MDHKVGKAAGATITFTSAKNQLQRGERTAVVCTVQASTPFTDADFYISYDPKMLKFEAGGNKVSGGKGLLHVASVGNTVETDKFVYSLSFVAKKKGTTVIAVSNQARVVTAAQAGLSVSSNRLTLNISNDSDEDGIEMPAVSATPTI
ncbi:MAG: hypothetical protein LBR68_02820, partial [Lachnoclostridium sp.]|nr:hypothetical protein [Lachnoclostridium sp.]